MLRFKHFFLSLFIFLFFAPVCASDIESPASAEPAVAEMPAELNTVWAMMLEKLIPYISDEEEKQFIQSVVDDTSLLSKKEIADRAQEIFGRVQSFKELQSYEQLAKSEEDKEFIAEIMQDLSLLEKEDIHERFKEIVAKIKAENFGGKDIVKSVDKNFDRLKLGLISFFTLYRKMMFVHDLDNGHMPGSYQTWFNRFAMAVFMGGSIVQQIIKGIITMQNDPSKIGDIVDNAPDALSDTGFEAHSLVSNDLYDHMSVKNENIMSNILHNYMDGLKFTDKDRSNFYRRPSKAKFLRPINFFGVFNKWVQSEAEEFEEGYNLLTPLLLKKEIQKNGCPGHILDFYNQFDSYLNNEIEKHADFILEKVKVPNVLRILMLKNGVSRFAQKAFLFKILPTYFHWVGKNLRHDPFKFGQEYDGKSITDIYVKDYFKSSIPFKEVVKSVGELGRATAVGGIARAINGKMTTTNKGRFYKAKEYTAGLAGPNTLKFVSELMMPFVMVNSSDLISGKDNFLKYKDFPGQKKLIKNGVGNYIAERTVSYITQTFISFAMLKLLKTKKIGMVSWTGEKIKKFLMYLAKKEIIDEETIDIISMLAPMIQFVPLLYMLKTGDTTLLTQFDSQEAAFESQQMGDQYRELDYYIANIVGKLIGASIGTVFANFAFPKG